MNGLASNDDFARILSHRYEMDITGGDISRWRRQYWRFNSAIACALDDFMAVCTNVVVDAVEKGDVASAKWAMERGTERWKPRSQLQLDGRLEGLTDMLKRRTERDLYDEGILEEPDDE